MKRRLRRITHTVITLLWALIPIWVSWFLWWLLDPQTFWQGLTLLIVIVCIITLPQIVLAVAGIVKLIDIWELAEEDSRANAGCHR